MTYDMVEHTVEIDEYISATIKIPKKLTAIELKALMVKANKLFNLAEVPIVAKRAANNVVGRQEAISLIKMWKEGLQAQVQQRLKVNDLKKAAARIQYAKDKYKLR